MFDSHSHGIALLRTLYIALWFSGDGSRCHVRRGQCHYLCCICLSSRDGTTDDSTTLQALENVEYVYKKDVCVCWLDLCVVCLLVIVVVFHALNTLLLSIVSCTSIQATNQSNTSFSEWISYWEQSTCATTWCPRETSPAVSQVTAVCTFFSDSVCVMHRHLIFYISLSLYI
jgi:hypothetical protein